LQQQLVDSEGKMCRVLEFDSEAILAAVLQKGHGHGKSYRISLHRS
jgi:hypothetical protein